MSKGMQIGNVNFNIAHANKVSEDQFLEDHAHHADTVDLKAAYKALQTKTEAKAESKKVTEKA